MEYPKRDPFFAHKFIRLLHKAAVASEIGRDAFALLTVIAHTEDAMRYRGAAKFWNSQLIETLGFKKWDQFDACRKRAIEAGWLVYRCHGKRMAGEYWVTIPDGYEMVTDAPLESYPENGYDIGYKDGYDVGYKEGMIEGTNRGRSGGRTGDEQGEPSIPTPTPSPKPKTQSDRFTESDEQTAIYIWEQIHQAFPNQRKPNMKTWSDTIRLMRERDQLADAEIRRVFDWAHEDDFWRPNILSPRKLRDKWNVLAARADTQKPKPEPEPGSPEWRARSIRWLDGLGELQDRANRGEITDAEFNRTIAEWAAAE